MMRFGSTFDDAEPLEATLRRVIREELSRASKREQNSPFGLDPQSGGWREGRAVGTASDRDGCDAKSDGEGRCCSTIEVLIAMQPASSTLKKIFADTLRREGGDDAPLLAWPLACGSKVAEKTSAIGYADGVLHGRGSRRDLAAAAAEFRPAISCGPEADQRAAGERDQVCGGEPDRAGPVVRFGARRLSRQILTSVV